MLATFDLPPVVRIGYVQPATKPRQASMLTNVMPDRIRALRIARKMTQTELAERAGTTFTTVSKLERSTRGLSLAWVERLARALEVDPQELLFGTEVQQTVRQVPLVGQIAAGNWREAIEDAVGFVPAVGVGKDAFALRPEGDSMNKVLPEGAVVVIDPAVRELRDGLIYAVMNGESETTLKRYRADPARLEPCSTNPDHQAIVLGQEPFTVLGRAVQAVTDL